MSTITERALNAMPGYREQDLVKRLRAARTSLETQPPGATDVQARILELAESDSPIPLDIAAPMVEQQRNHQLLIARREAIDRAIESITTDTADVARSHGDDALAVLNKELQKLVAAVQELAPKLAGITRADDAIEAGPGSVSAYKKILELVSDYDEIRTVQRTILEKQDKEELLHARPLMHSGLIADAINTHPWWGVRRSDAADQSRAVDEREQAFLAWLHDGYRIASKHTYTERGQLDRSWWPNTNPSAKVEHLVRLATETRPWVPSRKQLRLAEQLANEATTYITREHQSAGVDYNLRALGALCELTGTSWPRELPLPMTPAQHHNQRTGADKPAPTWNPALELKNRLALV